MFKDNEMCRMECRRFKWENGITYKVMANDWLKMNYNSFMNFIHGHTNLSHEKLVKLQNAFSHLEEEQ